MSRDANGAGEIADPRLRYRRQFVLGPHAVSPGESWVAHELAQGLCLSSDSLLQVARTPTPHGQLVLLGHMLAPDAPDRDNQAVLSALAHQAGSFAELEAACAKLAGRWILIAEIGSEWRLYPDAAGLRSAFYGRIGSTPELWVCSQPKLLVDSVGLEFDAALEAQFDRGNRGNAWPGELTPYPAVKQLLPNHYLNLGSGESHRFWSGEDIGDQSVEEAAERIAEILSSVIEAAVRRGPVALPVTGGYDSRVLLACAGKYRTELKCFCTYDPSTPRYDIALAKKVGDQVGISVSMAHSQPFPESFWSAYRDNVGDMFWDPGSVKLYTTSTFCEGHTILMGGVAEIGRCFFYKEGRHPAHVEAADLARRAGYSGNEVATSVFDDWLSRFPQSSRVSELDLFYWEHRLGNWLAMGGNAFDAMVEVIHPFNCRRLIEVALAAPLAARKDPYLLFRKICELRSPELLNVGFNEHWSATLEDFVESVVHWRLRRAWTKLRMRLIGISHIEEL